MSKYFRIRGIEEDEIFRNLFIDYIMWETKL